MELVIIECTCGNILTAKQPSDRVPLAFTHVLIAPCSKCLAEQYAEGYADGQRDG